jgi:hypothetical protein
MIHHILLIVELANFGLFHEKKGIVFARKFKMERFTES